MAEHWDCFEAEPTFHNCKALGKYWIELYPKRAYKLGSLAFVLALILAALLF